MVKLGRVRRHYGVEGSISCSIRWEAGRSGKPDRHCSRGLSLHIFSSHRAPLHLHDHRPPISLRQTPAPAPRDGWTPNSRPSSATRDPERLSRALKTTGAPASALSNAPWSLRPPHPPPQRPSPYRPAHHSRGLGRRRPSLPDRGRRGRAASSWSGRAWSRVCSVSVMGMGSVGLGNSILPLLI